MGDLRKEFFIMDKAQNSVPYLFVVSLRHLDYRVPARRRRTTCTIATTALRSPLALLLVRVRLLWRVLGCILCGRRSNSG